MNARDIARGYISRGWPVVPVPFRSKRSRTRGWQKLRITVDQVDEYFAASKQNVGVLLGQSSLVDVDLDSPEAMEFAPVMLPSTATFGHASKRQSHWLFYSDGAVSCRFEDAKAKTEGRECLLFELHSTGRQTVFPGSTHESGELIEWDNNIEPTTFAQDDLLERLGHLAAVCVWKRNWPAPGGRHDAALAVTGVLVRMGTPADATAEIVTALNGGESFRKHLALAMDAVDRLAAGDRPLSGIPKMRDVFGATTTDQVVKWLQLIPPKPSVTDVSEAVAGLSMESTPEEIAETVALLRSASLNRVQTEGIFQKIKKRTGTSITTLKAEYAASATGLNKGEGGQARQLVEIGRKAELFYDDQGMDTFARIERDGHREIHRIGSASFDQFLARALYEKTGAVPDRAAIQSALNVLSGFAKIEGQVHRTWLRVAQDGDAIYVDLGDPTWRAVRITADGWEVVSDPPVRFRRSGGQALPEPERGGSIQDLRPFVNTDDLGFMLVVGFAVNAFRPDKPFPVLLLTGEKGTAKSTLLGLLRLLIDPAPAPGAGLPRTEGDLVVVAKNNWLMSGDNVSSIPDYMADALCRLATGGGIRKRMLYTDAEEYAIDVRRPVILTSLSAVTGREDFLDREVMVTLKRIEGNRKTEEEVLKDFAAVRARILGALFDGVATGLRMLPSTQLEDLPRMADFVTFATAAGHQYGWDPHEFSDAYELMAAAVFEESAMGDPVIKLIADWMFSQTGDYPGFDGSPSELLEYLTTYADVYASHLLRRREWPKSAGILAKRLRAAQTGLGQLGVDATVTRTSSNKSLVILRYVGKRPDIGQTPF